MHQTTTITRTGANAPNSPKHRARKHHRVPKFYVVRSGDTLGRISSRMHVPVSVLTTLNSSLAQNPNSLQTGQRLRLRR